MSFSELKSSFRILTLVISSFYFFACQSSAQINKLLEKAGQLSSTPTGAEISSGLKEALEKGTGISVDRLSLENGYLGNLDVKILFPEEAKQAERTLRNLGMGSLCDQVITSVNRAAEDAAMQAKPIFTAAIKQMSFQDVQKILLGEQNAATQYFQKTTSDSLTVKFKPVIEKSLEKVNATKYWDDLVTQYNKVPMVKKMNPDLTTYVTQKAIDGLFVEIAKEELKIRNQLGARTSPLLQKVFGYAESQKK
ncbi:uncharacterized protein DUF4197 [Algoriphagus boseongensis]|uniref:Uncharacterized protein DUF4197 n=1 Tax=Algoriphagus boseongensis TaxID=1442587 RepID=A0A4R6T855_9BACT|nr:DUF4197 domain-containing protein [Algoriphagus boseongensis]TDQ18389.1 uncharacterized protein DUF4197 [Algoriphagus boseongensis]